MIIDDECEGSFDEKYQIITNIVAPPVNQSAPVNLASCLHREAKMT
jgi:hypothetical protein